MSRIVNALRELLGIVRPTPGTTEAATIVGLALVAVGFVLRGNVDLAFIVPGVIVTFVALIPALVQLRRGG